MKLRYLGFIVGFTLMSGGCNSTRSSSTPTGSTATTQASPSNASTDTEQQINKILGDPGKDAEKTVRNAPQLDNSTPDKTVESFWILDNYITSQRQNYEQSATQKALSSWYKQSETKQDQVIYDLRKRCVEEPMLKNYQPNSVDEVDKPAPLQDVNDPYTTSSGDNRKIQNVDMQTPTRAVVWVKLTNPKPIPPDVRSQMIDMDIKAHDDGISAQYILDKDKSGWKIMDIIILSSITGEWEDKFNAPKPEYQPGAGSYYTPSEGELY